MWWDDVLAAERERCLVELRKELADADQEVRFWQSTNVAGASPENLVRIDVALRGANNRFWKAYTAYQAALQSTPS